MKQIIERKLYDTETATKIGRCDNGFNGNDFDFESETLYYTKNEQYFIHGEGGPRSSYGTRRGNLLVWGEQIEPISHDKARCWAEEKLTAEEYIEEFGQPEDA